jgi:hypothetical protein
MELVFKEKEGHDEYAKLMGPAPDGQMKQCWQTGNLDKGYYISVLSRWTGFEYRDIESALVRKEDGKRTEFYLCTSFDARSDARVKECKNVDDLVILWKKVGNWFSAPEEK